MPGEDYVYTYLHLWCRMQDQTGTFAVRNYLEMTKHLKPQARRAQKAKADLLERLPKVSGYKTVHGGFEINGEKFLINSMGRVFSGKGAPSEIQDAVYLASLAGLVTQTTLPAYADSNLGVDCGGFVANYWGMGRPSDSSPAPVGWDGFKPRYIWEMYRSLRRKDPAQIQMDDAAIFFSDVLHDNPDIPAKQRADGSYDSSTGSQAFHIALVNKITSAGGGKYWLEIAESSEAAASSGGNGVNVRFVGQDKDAPQMSANIYGPPSPQSVEIKAVHGLACYVSGKTRVYFVGKPTTDPPYPQEHQTT